MERSSETVRRQPIEQSDAKLVVFGLPARQEALEALVDAHFHHPSGGAVRYRPAAPLVIFGCARIGTARMASDDRDRGRLSEVDVAFWVPLVGTRRVAGVEVADRLVWFHPWIFVDSSAAVVHGREIYGFPKAFASFAFQDDGHGLASFSLDALVLLRLGGDVPNEMRRLITVTRERLEDRDRDLGTLEAYLSPFRELTGLGPIEELRTRVLASHEVRIVFLKQFRDITDGQRACYQAICEAPAVITRFRRMRALRGDYRMKIESYASHRIAEDLGLEGADVRPEFAAEVEMDFVMECGVEIWRA